MNPDNNPPVKGDILIVSGDLPSLSTLSSMLTTEGYEVRGVPDGKMALTVIENKPPELILLDVKMPGMDGFEVCQQIKADEKLSGMPILFLSALDEVTGKVKGFEAGAVDFITKPFQAEEVLARVDTHITLSRLSRNLEERVEKRTAELTESEEALSEQIAFERLIAELAARLARVRPENMDAEIQETLGSLGRFLAAERAFIFQFTEDGKSLKNTNVWAEEGFSPQAEIFDLDLAADVPWVARQILSGGVIIVGPGYAGLPDEARELKQQLESDGINSGFAVPIIIEGMSIGMLGLDTVDKARQYPAPLMKRMRVLADMIGSTLKRVRAQRRLEQYQHIVESTTSIVGLVDRNYVYQYANDAYSAAFQKDRQGIIGLSVADLFGHLRGSNLD